MLIVLLSSNVLRYTAKVAYNDDASALKSDNCDSRSIFLTSTLINGHVCLTVASLMQILFLFFCCSNKIIYIFSLNSH